MDGIVGLKTQAALKEGSLVVDGLGGKAVTGALQKVLEMREDNIISGRYRSNMTRMIYSTHYSSPYTGNDVIRTLQRLLGANADGFIRVNTVGNYKAIWGHLLMG